MIELVLPLSELKFAGTLKTHGTNGPGDLVYVRGKIGPLEIDDIAVDRNLVDDDPDGGVPDEVQVTVRLEVFT